MTVVKGMLINVTEHTDDTACQIKMEAQIQNSTVLVSYFHF